MSHLPGDAEDKRRLRVILETLAGACTVARACERLGIHESRFHVLRQRALSGALAALHPGRPGRPRKAPAAADRTRVEDLERTVRALELEVEARRVRAELDRLGRLGRCEKKNESGRKSSNKRR